jgi:hypothetical protein
MSEVNFDTQDTTNEATLKEHLAKTGSEMKQRAGEVLQASTDAARERVNEVADLAKSVASETYDRVQDQAKTQQNVGADFMGKFAGNLRNAAKSFDHDVPLAASGINAAANYVEGAAEKVRNGSLQDLFSGATDLAKRQPAAFLGLSVLVGFTAVRFLKAAAGAASSETNETSHD